MQKTETYKLMRGWRDGESMQPHEIDTFTDIDTAIDASFFLGGYVQRISDGAVFVGGAKGWINPQTGEVK